MQVLRQFRASDVQLEDAKRSIITHHQQSLTSDLYWLQLLTGQQSDDIPSKNATAISELRSIVESLTTEDIHDIYSAFNFRSSDKIHKCIAVSGQEPTTPVES